LALQIISCAVYKEHKDGTFGSFTAKYRCHRLVWFESYSWIDKAIAREKELKGRLRAKKIALIQQNNPTWVDLSGNIDQLSPKRRKSRSFASLRMTSSLENRFYYTLEEK